MARIRSIKPEFWADEKLAPLRPIDRLVFLGLISQADDDGRLVDAVRLLDGLIFPETEDSVAESLEILARLSRIRRYHSASGQALIQIVGWARHQRVDKPSKYTLPPPPPEDVPRQQFSESLRESPEDVARVSGDARAPINDLGSTINDLGSGKDLSKSKSISTCVEEILWPIYIDEFGGNPPHPKLTKKRRQVLGALWREQLQGLNDPEGTFRQILRAVKSDDFYLSRRAYQMPESLFRNAERRDRWVNVATNGSGLEGLSAGDRKILKTMRDLSTLDFGAVP